MSKIETCARCGHDRVFHQVGTGNGVPIGREFCDDRHSEPCECTEFASSLPTRHYVMIYEDRYGAVRHGETSDPDRWRRELVENVGSGEDLKSARRRAREARALEVA